MTHEFKKNLGSISPKFIQPGIDADYPGTDLHVRANEQEIHIFSQRKSKNNWWARAICIDDDVIGVDVKTKGRRTGIHHLDVHAGNFILFAIEYFTQQNNKPPTKFKSYWIKRKSINYSQFKKAMGSKKDTPQNRRIAAQTTWTAHVLQDTFEVESADIEPQSRNIDVWFKRK